MKLIYLRNKKHYICNGASCNKCKLRFKCYTEKGTLIIDWLELHSQCKGSPSMVLRELVGSNNKIFVSGSKKFKELYDTYYKNIMDDSLVSSNLVGKGALNP